TLIYTSGTTGRPKGCALTHANFLAECDTVVELLLPVFEKVSRQQPSTLLFLPLAHVLGRMVEVACVRARIRLGHAPSIKPEELRADLAGFHPTFLLGVPYLFEKIFHTGRAQAESIGRAASFDRAAGIARRYGQALLSALSGGPGPDRKLRAAHALYDVLVYRRIRKALGGDIRFAVCGGSSLSPDLLLFFAGAGVLIYEGYGLTETTAAVTVNPPLRPRPGSVGMPIPGAGVRISDEGEIEVRGGMVFARYREQPEARLKPAADPEGTFSDGWFSTGDLGRIDQDGYLYVTGRKKELIITNGGKNVSPAPMEDRLRVHPLISQCLVVGNDRPFVAALITLDAEAAEAFVEKMPGGDRYAGPLREHPALRAEVQGAVDEVNETVSRAESIRKFVILEGDFTEENGMLTPSLKVKRRIVEQGFADAIEGLYAKAGPAPDQGLESAAG
ncbi:long-chain fatty acid--CoA ligase, partial [Mangrovactinospora gilvigrisea]